MIIVELYGGLGNQLFQYSIGRNLSLKHNVPLRLDISKYEKYQLHAYSLQHFNINAPIATQEELNQFPITAFRSSFSRGFFSLLKQEGRLLRVKEKRFVFDERVLTLKPPFYIQGYWQTEKYFLENEKQLREDLAILKIANEVNTNMAEQIKSVNSVSVHVRRRDYVNDSSTHQIHGVCSLEYYKRAMSLIRTKVQNPWFFVFSDDQEWSKKEFAFEKDIIFLCQNQADRNYEDLRLMSFCKNHIIANSTFSWWGAWLGKNPKKIIMAPKKWFQTNDRLETDIIPADWIRL